MKYINKQQTMKNIHGWYNKLFWNMGVIAILEKPYLLTSPPPHTHTKWKHINKHLIFSLAHYFSLCNFYPSFNHMETEASSFRCWKLTCEVELFSLWTLQVIDTSKWHLGIWKIVTYLSLSRINLRILREKFPRVIYSR